MAALEEWTDDPLGNVEHKLEFGDIVFQHIEELHRSGKAYSTSSQDVHDGAKQQEQDV